MAATFSVRFVSADLLSPKGRVASTFDTQRLEILRTGSGEIPVVENTELPSTPQVYLQIWSVGKIEPRPYGPAAGKGSVPILNLDPHNKNQDRLCANIGGYIQQSEAGYQFVALEPPTRGPGPQRAWMHLHYGGRPGEQALGQEGSRIPLVSDRQDEWVVLAAALTLHPGTETDKPLLGTRLKLLHLTQVVAAQLLDLGGLAVTLHVAIPGATGDDAAFPVYGQWVAQRTHSLGIGKHGELVVGSTAFCSTATTKGSEQILATLEQIRREVGRLLPGMGADPKIARLVLATHGDTEYSEMEKGVRVKKGIIGLQMGPEYLQERPDNIKERWLGVGSLPAFTQGLATHLCSSGVITLCCCWAGSPPYTKTKVKETPHTREVKDKDGNTFTENYVVKEWVGDYCILPEAPRKREQVGAGSFADRLCKGLNEQPGLGDVVVWGHASRGDGLWNMQLRAFTRHGNMDLCYLALKPPWRPGGRTLTDANGKDWTIRFQNGSEPKLSYLRPGVWRALDMSFRHPGALIQELLTDEAGPALDTPPPVVLRPGETVPVGAADWLVLQVEDAGASPAPDAGSLVGMVTQTTEDARAPHMPAPTPLPDKPAPPTRPISPRDPGLQGFAFIQELTRRFEARPKKPVPVEKKTHHPAKQVELEAQYAERMQLWARELVDIRYNEEATWAHEMRDMAILEQLKAGNVPDFCRPDLASAWHPVRLDHPDRHISGIVYVLSDVLAVGNNEDYVRVPISGYTSQMIADHWGCCLPTSRVIRQAYVAADRKMVLHNFGTGLATMSNAALLWHDAIVQGRVESLAADPMLSELAEMAGRGGAAAEEAVLLLRAVVSAGLPDLASTLLEGIITSLRAGLPTDPFWELHRDLVAAKLRENVDVAANQLKINFRVEDIPECRVHAGRCHCPAKHPGTLVVGHKKEVVVSRVQDRKVDPETRRPLLVPGSNPPQELLKPGNTHKNGRSISFIGFFDSHGVPTDRLITPDHSPGFKDYAQGTRLVHPIMYVRDLSTGPEYFKKNYIDMLCDPILYRLAVDHPDPKAQTGIPWGTPGIPDNKQNGPYCDIGPIDWPRYPDPDPSGNWKA